MKPSPTVIPFLLLALASCTVTNTEEETLQVSLSPLFFSEAEPFVSGARALRGSRTCVEVDQYVLDGGGLGGWGLFADDDWRTCYEVIWSDATIDDPCTDLDVLGERTAEIVPRGDCFVEDITNDAPDRFRLQVVEPDGLRGRLEWWQERLAEIYLHPGPRGSFPGDMVPAIDEPLRLVPDVAVAFPVVLVDAAGELVAWDREQGRVIESRDGAAPRELAESEEATGFSVRIGAGERSTIALALPELELPVAEVIATPADEAASIEVVVAYHPGDERETTYWNAPLAARALVRDAEGNAILGTAVEWTLVEGHLALTPGTGDFTVGPPEYLTVLDACVPPPREPELRRATLRAELGALVHEVELEWTAVPEDEPDDEPFEPHEACQRVDDGLGERGCGCSTQPSRGAGWLALGIVVLGAAARRRPRRSRDG